MTQQTTPNIHDPDGLWQETVVRGHRRLRGLRRAMRLLPGSPRCKVCHNPFGGFGGLLCRSIGMKPSRKNPQLCALCCEGLPPGGAETETVVLFADIRGSTQLSKDLGPTAYADLLNRYYRTATDVLIRHDATIDKLIGDEVMAFFVTGFAGPEFKQSAIKAAVALLRGVGYGTADGPWLPVGIGVDAGTAFVGNVGGGDYVDFTVLGDPVNVAAHLQSAALPGELLIGDGAFNAVADHFPDALRRDVKLKGHAETLGAWVMTVPGLA